MMPIERKVNAKVLLIKHMRLERKKERKKETNKQTNQDRETQKTNKQTHNQAIQDRKKETT